MRPGRDRAMMLSRQATPQLQNKGEQEEEQEEQEARHVEEEDKHGEGGGGVIGVEGASEPGQCASPPSAPEIADRLCQRLRVAAVQVHPQHGVYTRCNVLMSPPPPTARTHSAFQRQRVSENLKLARR